MGIVRGFLDKTPRDDIIVRVFDVRQQNIDRGGEIKTIVGIQKHQVFAVCSVDPVLARLPGPRIERLFEDIHVQIFEVAQKIVIRFVGAVIDDGQLDFVLVVLDGDGGHGLPDCFVRVVRGYYDIYHFVPLSLNKIDFWTLL